MRNLIILVIILSSTSCSTMLGIKKINSITTLNIEQVKNQYNIDTSYIIDKEYFSNISSLKDSSMLKHHIQPLQALYFDKNGNNIAVLINCNAPGLTNLHWEKSGDLTNFPPKTPNVYDTVSLNSILKATQIKQIQDDKMKVDYTILVFWNDFMGRQTKRFINALRQNINLKKSQQIRVIYINNDNLYAD